MHGAPSSGGSTARAHEGRGTPAPGGSPAAASLVGQTLSHYHIVQWLASGQMGEVYRARDTLLERDVAIKVILPELCLDPDRVKRFQQEARAAGAINHPNVCLVFDVGTHANFPFVVMELLQGSTLRERLMAGPIQPHRAIQFAAQAARGLAAAHEKGIVHRDLKPANLFVTKAGPLKVLDFGLAKLTKIEDWARKGESGGLGDTSSTPDLGQLVGTAAYMAPEQVRCERVDPRSDIFALGAILYELLTGRRAFSAGSYVETLSAILTQEPGSISSSGVAVSEALELIVQRCLEKSPDERFQSASDLAFDLECLLRHAPPDPERRKPDKKGIQLRFAPLLLAGGALIVVGLAAGRLSTPEPRVDLNRYQLKPFATQLQAAYRPHWSPDGKSIAFVGQTEEAGAQVYVQAAQMSAPVQLTQPPFEWDFQYAWLAWTPDARSIYCPGAKGKDRGIFMIPVGGGDPILVQRDATAGALSPDGSTLLMLARGGHGEWRVWYASPPSAPRRPYEPAPFSTASIYDTPSAEFTADGKNICLQLTATEGFRSVLLPWPPGKAREAPVWMGGSPVPGTRFTIYSGRDKKIYLVDTRDGSRWPVFVWTRPIWGAAVSPDGKHIAFPSNESQTDVIAIPIDGGPAKTLLGGLSSEDMPALCSEGRELVYISDRSGTEGAAWVHDMKMGTDRELLRSDEIPFQSGEATSMLMNPALSPDCRRLAVAAVTGPSTQKIFLVHTSGGTPVRATADLEGIENAPTWSPDGERLAYLRADANGWSLFVTRVGDVAPPVQLAGTLGNLSADAGVQMPQWSPRGNWIAVADSAHVILVSPDGHQKRYIRTTPGPLAWAPDGRTIYVVHMKGRRGSLAAIDSESGAERIIRDLGEFVPWGFENPGNRVSVTPDGKALIYRVLRTRSEIWLLDGVRIPRPWYARFWPEPKPRPSG